MFSFVEYQKPKEKTAGTIQKITFTPPNSKTKQTFFIYLPKDYNEKNNNKHYHTLYHLHGAFMKESWVGQECKYIAKTLENIFINKTKQNNSIPQMIIVCPVDPDGDQMWSDSKDGVHLASTSFLRNCIPYIDNNYRTISERRGRTLQGFSMGGFGAVVNGFKEPHLFSSLVVWDGALHDWNTLSMNRKEIAEKMFGNDEDYFEQWWSPYTAIERGAKMKKMYGVEMPMFVVVGRMEATRHFASRFRPHMEKMGMEVVNHDVACSHDIFSMLDKLGNEAFLFMAKHCRSSD